MTLGEVSCRYAQKPWYRMMPADGNLKNETPKRPAPGFLRGRNPRITQNAPEHGDHGDRYIQPIRRISWSSGIRRVLHFNAHFLYRFLYRDAHAARAHPAATHTRITTRSAPSDL